MNVAASRSAVRCHSVSAGRHRTLAVVRPRTITAATSGEEPGPSTATAGSQEQPVIREYKAWGVKVIESNESLPGPEIEKDFWEGEQFQAFGEAMEKFFLPGLVLLGVVCGGIAAQTYNQGADVFMTSATPESLPQLVPADLVLAAPPVAQE